MMLVDITQFFIVFKTFCSLLQAAELARVRINGFKLDRAHTFAVNKFNAFEFDRLMKVLNERTCPESMPYAPWVITSFLLVIVE